MEKNETQSYDFTDYYGGLIIMPRSAASKFALRVSRSVLNVFMNILFYAVVIVVIVRASSYAYDFSYQVFGSMSKDDKPGYDVEIQILPGESTYNIAMKLETKEVIINKYSFFVKTKLKKYNIIPGTFVLNTSMDYDEILEVITDASKSITGDNNAS